MAARDVDDRGLLVAVHIVINSLGSLTIDKYYRVAADEARSFLLFRLRRRESATSLPVYFPPARCRV